MMITTKHDRLLCIWENPVTAITTPPIHYPSGDGQPVAKTFDHLDMMVIFGLEAGRRDNYRIREEGEGPCNNN
jgi:hypothetical protein